MRKQLENSIWTMVDKEKCNKRQRSYYEGKCIRLSFPLEFISLNCVIREQLSAQRSCSALQLHLRWVLGWLWLVILSLSCSSERGKLKARQQKKCAVFTESSWSPMLLSSTSYTKYCCFPFLYVSGEMFYTQKSQQLKNLSEIHMVTWFAFHRSSLFAGAMIFCCFWKNNLCSSWEIHASSCCSYIFLKQMFIKNLFAIPKVKLWKGIFLRTFPPYFEKY